MKKIFNLSMLAIAAMAAFACTEEIVDPESNEIPSVENPLVINALADDDIAPDTKTSLSGVSIRWATTDAIAGYEGSTKHTSTKTDISDGGKLATFTFSGVSVGTNLDYLIYPAAAAGAEDAGLFEITLPTEQEATADSFADGANVALAEGKVADDAVLFKNLGALIGIKVNNDNIESVKISANEDMTGAGIADPSDFSAIADSGEKYVQLTGGLNNGEDYYAVVYPSPLAGYTGLQIVAENTVGQTATYSNSNPLVLARNDNKRIANLSISSAKWTPSYESWTHTFTAKTYNAVGAQTLSGKSWTLANTGSGSSFGFGYDATKGQQFGTASDPFASFTLTSNFGVSAGIRAITVYASTAKDAVATLSVSVGGVAYKISDATSTSLTTTNTAYTFVSPNGKVKTGDIVISISQSTEKGLYIKTITVNGKDSPELSFVTSSYSFPNGSSDYLAFTGQSVTNPHTVPIASYSSSDETIATVDSDGNVTLKGKLGSTTITATSEETLTYAEGTATYTITVTETPKVYVKATSIISGKSYLLITKYGAGYYMANPVPGGSDNAYLGKTDVSEPAIDGSVSIIDADDNLFTFTTSGLGYTIQQSDDRYIYQSGTYTKVQVNASTPGSVWSATKQTGGEFKLQYGDYWLQYSSGYTSYGLYSSEQANSALPFLFIEDDGSPRIGGTSIARTSAVAGNETSTLMTGNLSNVTYTATSKPAWVGTITFAGNTMTVPVNNNTGLASRNGTITVRATGDEGYVETDIAISQVASVFTASSTDPIVIAYDDLTAKTVTFTSTFTLTAANVTNSNTTNFITSIARVGETDNYTLSITAKAANTSGAVYNATISITRDELPSFDISVTQNYSGGTSPLSDPTNVAITAMKGSGFTAKWDNNTDADGFSWWLSTDEPGDFNETDNIIASGDEGDADLDEGVYTLSVAQALTGKTPYYFYVKAEGSGSWEDSADYGTDVKGYLLFDGSTLTSTATTAATDKTYYTNLTLTFSDGAKCIDVPGTAANAFLKGTGKGIFIGKSGKYINNSKSAIPGDIVKFELYSNKNASMKVSVGVKFGSSALAAYNATGAYTATLSTDDSVYDCSGKLVEHSKYFWFQVTNANNAQLQFLIMYEPE